MSKRSYEAWRGGTLFEQGIGNVVIARHKPSGETEAGVFLIDVFCLGAKNGFFLKVPASRWQETLEHIFEQEGKEPLTPACARKLVEDAVAYARSLGLPPHPDYRKAARVLGGIDPSECHTVFTLGKDGKPFYIQGPNDSPGFARRVMTALAARCGQGNYDFLINAPGSERWPDDDDEPPGR